ncbi:cytochrome P450 [Actinomycetospora endophytica]|uniref:Cytochrome P450 n=1 Tax=Actinomycetospora endophytica TaxID=2291215 RepID=A0ABS8PA63_9PSEU|nr:cytochrome P450 [Actinomycetospora endophytica]MCD2195134.1 cytochrome P450 [Actinomycetospora endophytica]
MDLVRDVRLGARLAVMRGGGRVLALAGDPVLRLLYRPWIDDPHAIHRQLREGPQPFASRGGVMVVATAAACEQVVRDRRYGVRTRAGGTPGGAVDGTRDPLLEPVDLSVLGLDPPEHTRLRRLVAPVFTPARVAAREDLAVRMAARLVDRAVRLGRFDLVSAVAVPLPVAIIADILGVPDADADAFAHWGRAVGAGLGGVRSLRALHRLERAVVELRALMSGLLDRRRAGRSEGDGDVLDRLAAEDVSDDEAVSLAVLLLLGGFETTSGLIGNAVAAMLDTGEPWQQLVDDPAAGAPAVVEETLRYDPPVQFTARVPHVEVELGDRTIAPDTTVLAMLGAAGRDPAVHTDPDTFDPTRTTAAEHLAFSGGIHYCLGASLARLEGRVALTELATRMPRLRRLPGAERRRSLLLSEFSRLPLDAGR